MFYRSPPCCFFILHLKAQPFLLLEHYRFPSYPDYFLSSFLSFMLCQLSKIINLGALNHLPLLTTALKLQGLSVFRAVHRQVIKISNLIFNSVWIKPLRHFSAVWAKGGINQESLVFPTKLKWGRTLHSVRQDNMKTLPCYLTTCHGIVVDAFCEFLLSGNIKEKAVQL